MSEPEREPEGVPHPNVGDLHIDLPVLLLEGAKADYADVATTWSSLETKAQGSIAVAGIFLAAVFAVARDKALLGVSSVPAIMAMCVLALVGSVLEALLALKVRHVPRPPTGETLEELINDLLTIDRAALAERVPRFYGDQARAWREVTLELGEANEAKATHLWAAQRLLVLAVVIAAVATLYLLAFVRPG